MEHYFFFFLIFYGKFKTAVDIMKLKLIYKGKHNE